MKKYKMTIEGMHCASCSGNVERSVSKIPGVKSVKVSVMMKRGFVEADDKVNVEDIKKAVTRAGYKTTTIEAA